MSDAGGPVARVRTVTVQYAYRPSLAGVIRLAWRGPCGSRERSRATIRSRRPTPCGRLVASVAMQGRVDGWGAPHRCGGSRSTTLPKISPDPVRPERAGASDVPDSLFDSLRRVLRELRLAGRDAEQRVGLHAAELDVLQHLSRERANSLSELADRTHTDLSSVSVVVRRLANRGLVARAAARDDARRLVIALTPAGRATLRRSPESARERLERVATQLTPQDQRLVTRALRRLADALGEDGRTLARGKRGARSAP